MPANALAIAIPPARQEAQHGRSHRSRKAQEEEGGVCFHHVASPLNRVLGSLGALVDHAADFVVAFAGASAVQERVCDLFVESLVAAAAGDAGELHCECLI